MSRRKTYRFRLYYRVNKAKLAEACDLAEKFLEEKLRQIRRLKRKLEEVG